MPFTAFEASHVVLVLDETGAVADVGAVVVVVVVVAFVVVVVAVVPVDVDDELSFGFERRSSLQRSMRWLR